MKDAERESVVRAISARIDSGEITAAYANVLLVRAERVRALNNRVPASVRAEFRAAVNRGELGHMKKNGLKPECYFHPNFEHLANAERAKIEANSIAAIMGCGVITRQPD